ncbi:MAG TPA: LPS assembly protein LptD [Pyrinomonadaceae bacterium]|nr:LPS assembly protein LptD [Pyrinomonadaceae bacterium]
MFLHQSIKILVIFCIFTVFIKAQDTNPVERQVSNPLTDTPNINPVTQEQTVKTPKTNQNSGYKPEGGDDELVVYSAGESIEGEEGNRIFIKTGAVDARYGIYRLQADKITIYEADSRMVAEGSVVFDQGEDQRITGARGEFNYRTKLGFFVDSTGFTNQTDDGTVIFFTADRVERVGLNEVVVTNGKFTACDETVPKWSFTADEARITTNDRIRLKNGRFRVLDRTILPVPFASIPIKKRDRASGFLTPTFGFSGNKGARLSTAYYKTLGRSADVTFRGDLYSARGVGFGMDVRTRANSRSFLNFGFFAVKDRIFGKSEDAENPDQGGSIVYADGVHYFSNGFTAVADVRLTSNLAFRQVFSDGIQQIISPIEVSQVFVNKSWDNYTLNLLARSQEISIPNVRIKTRNLPSINFDKRPSPLSFFKKAYFSFKTSLEGVSRREDVENVDFYRQTTGNDPVQTPAIGQRFDIHPQIAVPFSFKYLNVTATAGARVTYYSNSFNDMRQVVGRDVIRKYGEFELDLRPVALARNFYGKENAFRFRHTIEPFLTYRFIKGVDNFNRIIRFDYADTQTDTNEVEYGVTNRIFTRKYTEAVTDEAQKYLRENPDAQKKNPLSVQPYEIFTLTVRGKYFFDKDFGGALATGRRNQIEPISALTFYTFGGVPRRFSPLNIDATYRPRKTVFVNTRMDYGLNGDGVRDLSATVGYDTKLLKIFQTFYYTRAVTLIPSLRQFRNPAGVEAGTLRGSQWSPTVFLGDRDKGFYGGASLFFDFENRRALRFTPLISSLYTVGYAFDCCAVTAQYYTFNVGVRQENRFVFSFRLNGIGTFGTQQIGQGLR